MTQPKVFLTPIPPRDPKNLKAMENRRTVRTPIIGTSDENPAGPPDQNSSSEETSSGAELFSIQLAEQRPIRVTFGGGEIRLSVAFQVNLRTGRKSGWHSAEIRVEGSNFSDEEWGLRVTDSVVRSLEETKTEDSMNREADPLSRDGLS
ncbi:MAG: hypothetical protein ACK53L_12670, partial [Pirellulaceae bacterium]